MNPIPKRDDTITRANVERVTAEHKKGAAKRQKDYKPLTAEDLAAYFCGVGPSGNSYAEQRHIGRCWKLMIPKEIPSVA